MKKLEALFLSSVLALGFVTPAHSTESEYTVNQKTLAPFSGSTTTLTPQQKAQVKAAVDAYPSAEKFICTGIRFESAPMSENIVVRKRAKAACDYAKTLNPALSTFFQNKPTKARNYAGKVLLTLKTPLSKPFETPFPLAFSKQEVVDASLDEFKAYVKRSSVPKDVNLVFEEGFPKSQITWITKISQKAASTFPFISEKTPLVVIGTSDAFISETIFGNGLSHQGSFPCGRRTTYETYCAQTNWAALNYMASAAKPSEFGNPGKKAVVAHELFHVWQLSLHGAPNGGNIDHSSDFGVPIWLNEGLANFVGFAVAHVNGIEGYQPGRDRQVVQYMKSSSKPLAHHVGWDSDPYGIGMAASEYLVASVGFGPTLDIWFELAKGKTFRSAFRDATGVSLESFYERFEKVRSNFY